jgi:hypothetical protein
MTAAVVTQYGSGRDDTAGTAAVSQQRDWRTRGRSVAAAKPMFFSISGNKIAKNLKIFVEIDELRSRGVLCQL